jgi:hypothetical protein
MNFAGRKMQHYEVNEAEVNYLRTIGKLTSEKKTALVCLRSEDHDLIKSELIHLPAPKTK